MGMWMLAAAAAAKKKQDQRKAAARRERRRREEEERKSKEKYSRSYSDGMPSYIECVEKEIDGDEILKKFFQRLYEKMNGIRDEAGREYKEKAEEFAALADKYEAERDKVKERLEKSGINFGDNRTLGDIYLGRFSSEYQSSTWGKSRFSLGLQKAEGKHYYRSETIDGIEYYRITESLIMEDEPEAYLNIAKESLKKNEEERDALKKEFDKLEKRRLFISEDKKRTKLKALSNRLSELNNKIDKNRQAIKEHEFVLGLTDEQKADLVKLIKAENGIETATYEVRALESKFSQAMPRFDSEDLLFKAMQLMEAEGLTEEEITTIFKKLDRVAILRERGRYSKSYSPNNGTDRTLVELFIEKVYEADPDFVDRNLAEIVEPEEESQDKSVQDVSDNNENPEL